MNTARAGETAHEVAEALAIAHRVAVLAETDPAAPLIVATRAALEVADARRAACRDRRMVGLEVHGGDNARWARWADQWMPYTELAALRATPAAVGPGGAADGELRRRGVVRARTRNEPDGARGNAPKQSGVTATVPQKDGE